ncbi:MAG: hypothetical protein ACP5H0_07085, partial [Caldisericum sp.]|uniref:hypothetical protein n=1 Tax=Caldisericum sp. TaxID=2499687 RepID=UPI003D117E2F
KIKKTMNEHFFYRERLIKCSKKRWSVFYLYAYEDNDLKNEEERILYKEKDENKIGYDESDICRIIPQKYLNIGKLIQ